ncbi:MAG: transglycosylase domain-containing protein [Christensenellales bacterium]|jgi:1A family penicillin-binding protein
MGRHQERKSAKSAGRRIWGFIKISVLIGLVALMSGAIFVFSYLMGLDEWKQFDPSKIGEMQQTLLIYDRAGNETAALYNQQNRVYLPIDEIPDYVKSAFIAIEDARFYQHHGVDVIRILGAFINNLKNKKVQGGSTITQQLVKLTSLTGVKKMSRKIQEAVMAYELEQRYTKDEILEMYLNYIYFGNGAYGVEAAAKTYFGVHTSELTLAQAALLAGVIKGPAHYAPHLNLEKSIKRRNLVLSEMYKLGYITKSQKEQAEAEEVVLVDKPKNRYGYYTDMVLREAERLLAVDSEELLSGGYRIYTTLDQDIQQYLETLYADGSLFPKNAADGALCQSAFCVLDSETSEILAIVGGREYETRRGLNRATDIRRQPGSAIKPVIVYAPAIEKLGYSPATMVLDEKADFNGYVPKNFSDTYLGWVTMREALARSLNLPAVRVFEQVGVSVGKLCAASVGIPFDRKDVGLTLALGGFTTGMSPLTLCNAFTPFANGGYYSLPSCITRIEDGQGKVLYERPDTKKAVLSKSTAFLITSMLQTAAETGTARRVKVESVPIAAKTGTSSNTATEGNKDAWTVAYNPKYTMCCWMGFDSTDEWHSLPPDVTGGTYPAVLIKKMFEYLYKDRHAPDFVVPDSVVKVTIDARSLKSGAQPMLASAFTPEDDTLTEYFQKDRAPRQYSDYWAVPNPPHDLSVVIGMGGYPRVRFTPPQSFAVYRLMRTDLESGENELVGEYEGREGPVDIIDYDAQYGHRYEYHVIPTHPEILIDGEPMKGSPSARVVIELQDEEYYMP